MLHYPGSKYFVPITINAAKQPFTGTQKRICFDLSRINDVTFWSYLQVRGNLIVYDWIAEQKLSSFVVKFDSSVKSGELNFDSGALVANQDRTYFIEVSDTFSEPDDPSVFTCENAFLAMPMADAASPITDAVGNYSGVASNVSAFQTNGRLNADSAIALNETNGNINLGTLSQVNGAAVLTLSMIVTCRTQGGSVFFFHQSGPQRTLSLTFNGVGTPSMFLAAGTLSQYVMGLFDTNTMLLTLVFTLGAEPGQKIKAYINGVQVSCTKNPTMDEFPATLPVISAAAYLGKASGAAATTWDDALFTTDAKSLEWHQLEYNMFFDDDATITVYPGIDIDANVNENAEIIGYGNTAPYGELPYKGEYGLHYQAFKMLSPYQFGGDYDNFLQVLGYQFDKIYFELLDLQKEIYPDTAVMTLSRWEALFELSYSTLAGIQPEERQKKLLSKYVADGGLDRLYFEDIAKKLGYNIGDSNISDNHLRIVDTGNLPWRVGISRIDVDSFNAQVEGRTIHNWSVYGTRVESDEKLKELFTDLKPAWTDVVFINE